MKRLAILLLIGCSAGSQWRAGAPAGSVPEPPRRRLSTENLVPGPYAVGYREARWYPAQSSGDRLRFRDYIPALDVWDGHLHHLGFRDEEIVDLFDTLMQARHDAPAVEGDFPTVAIEVDSPAEGAFFAEFIASHGYIVTIGPTLGRKRVASTTGFLTAPARAERIARRALQALNAEKSRRATSNRPR